VAGIEEVLKVIEAYGIDIIFLALRTDRGRPADDKHEKNNQFFHIAQVVSRKIMEKSETNKFFSLFFTKRAPSMSHRRCP
jgi:hypothetical protein